MVPHVALQLALCSAMSKAPPETPVALRVRMAYRVGDPEVDRTFKLVRGDGNTAFVEFDVPSGLYHLIVEAPKFSCAAAKFVDVLPDLNRKVAVTLVDGPPAPQRPVLLMDGTAPMSFLYTKPSYVLVDKAVACNQAIGTPTPAPLDIEYDQGAYYLWMYPDPAFADASPTVAMRLRTPTGLAHYVRVPIPYTMFGTQWPGKIRFDVSEDMIDELATEKTDALLCPKLWETRVQ